jgi:quercetin dioxygenase-like cupin family protein
MMRETARKAETATVENPAGIFRTTIAYNENLMLCHFLLKKGARVPFHGHEAVQNGYLIRGKLRMLWETGREFIAEPGSGWCFDAHVRHGAEALEESEAIECFSPARPEYFPAPGPPLA